MGDVSIDVAAASTTDEPVASSALSYKTFSAKLAPGLTALGGALAVMGGLGAWVYTSQITTEGLAAQGVATTMGYSTTMGIAIAVLGGAVVAGSIVWLTRWFIPKLIPVAAAVALVVLVAMKLTEIDRDAAALAEHVREGALGFYAYHAGFGWGAWCMLAAAIAVVLGSIVGILREFDVRRGMA